MNENGNSTRLVLILISASTIILTISPGLAQDPCDDLEGYLDCTSTKKADVVIVMDTTGSMSGIIDQMKATALDFADGLEDSGIDYRLGLTEYKDFDLICDSYCGGSGDFPYKIYGITADTSEWQAWINGLYASGGWDWEESVLAAMSHTAIDQPWRDDAQKIAILMCDAPPHPDGHCCNAEGDTLGSTISDLTMNGVKAYVVYVGGAPDEWAYQMTESTGGRFYNGASSIRDILEDITGEISCSFNLENEVDCSGDEIRICTQMTGKEGALIPYYEGYTQAWAFVKCPDGSSARYDLIYDAAKGSYCATVPACAETPIEVTVWGRVCTWRTSTTLIACENNCPEPADDNYQAVKDKPLFIAADTGVLANDIDPDEDALSVASYDETTINGGTVLMNPDGSFTYTPFPGYCSEDVLDSFTYTASDGDCTSEPATVTIDVKCDAENKCPVAVPDEYETSIDTPLIVEAPGVLENDYDPDEEDSLIVSSYISITANGGTVVMKNDGSFIYTPKESFCGEDTFEYAASDGTCFNPPNTLVTITVTCNNCPVAEDDKYGAVYGKLLVVAADNGVLQNDNDIDGDDLTTKLMTGPSHGALTLNADGSFSYRPALGFLGADVFTYKAFDGKCYSDPATVTIHVAKCPWFIKNELYIASCGVDKVVPAGEGILANDVGAIAVVNPETITIDPKYGTIEVGEDGSFVYHAAENIPTGTYVQFKYTATNGVCEAKYEGIAKIQISCKCS